MSKNMKARGGDDAGALSDAVRVVKSNSEEDSKNHICSQYMHAYRVHANLLVTPVSGRQEVGHE